MSKIEHYEEEHRLEDIHAHVEDLTEAVEALRRLGDEEDIPAVERNAKRIEAAVDILDRNLPPETREQG